jgi:hypothetical protein
MKALVQKEFRENVRVAVLGLIIYTLVLVVHYRGYVASPTNMSKPLADSSFVFGTAWFCGIFGAVLGWLQVHNERRPDLWAFLIHRPMKRSEIFLGKVMAGQGLYALVVGLPLLGFIVWARLPGHVAAPFEPAMLWPVAVYVLGGVLYYFAGMLSDLRQVRWYGSRVLGLGTAIVVSPMLAMSPELWQSLLLILLGAAILATAVWGGFQSDGHYHGQPAWGKAALTVALLPGCLIVAAIATLLFRNFLPRDEGPWRSSDYWVTTNGSIYKLTDGGIAQQQFVDLDGKLLMDEKTGKPIDAAAFNRRSVTPTSFDVETGDDRSHQNWMQNDFLLAHGWRIDPDTLWYYWRRYGRLVGYDITTRRCIGSLGPKGFAADLVGAGDRFDETDGPACHRTLRTATTLFQVDTVQRATKPLFTTTEDDPILATTEVAMQDYGWQYTIVATKRFVYLLTNEGKPVWKAPYEPADPKSTRLQLYCLEPPGQFALWISSSGRPVEEAREHLPGRVMWVARDQDVLKSTDLPALPAPHRGFMLEEKLVSLVMPPALLAALPILHVGLWATGVPRDVLLLSLASGILLCLPIGLWLGRRYRFSIAALTGWAVFLLLFGVPGLLAFLSVQEWPAREACPNCKLLRLVDRPQCEHCSADFAPPEKTGTEVFAPLVASS